MLDRTTKEWYLGRSGPMFSPFYLNPGLFLPLVRFACADVNTVITLGCRPVNNCTDTL